MSYQGNRANEQSQSNSSPSNHLPECESWMDPTGVSYDADGNRNVCICPALRACEQRVRMLDNYGQGYHDAQAATLEVETRLHRHYAEQVERRHTDGYLVGLDAAEAAVKAIPYGGGGPATFTPRTVVAAIRALKEKP